LDQQAAEPAPGDLPGRVDPDQRGVGLHQPLAADDVR
jgi:hypothetical protein